MTIIELLTPTRTILNNVPCDKEVLFSLYAATMAADKSIAAATVIFAAESRDGLG